MARLNWNIPGSRHYETGIDRVVLYVGDNPGVAWPGVLAIAESSSGGEASPYYVDGVKYLNLSTREEFTATIEALSSPVEFDICNGVRPMAVGLLATQQPRKPFGLTYRTLIGSDNSVPGTDFKIHMIYNALAGPSSVTHKTLEDSPDVNTLSWDLTTLGFSYPGLAPIAHLVVDTRQIKAYTNPENNQVFAKNDIVENIESHLYGTDAYAPMLPTPDQMVVVMTGQLLERELAV